MRELFLLAGLMVAVALQAQSGDEQAIRRVLAMQSEAWNSGRPEAFMKGYWQSPQLLFVGQSGLTYGYDKTLENYRKGYPDTAAMGQLRFDLLEMKPLGKMYYLVVGKWHLKRSMGDVGGHFSLVWKKINGDWKIIADHSS